jgi:hypothetical protein
MQKIHEEGNEGHLRHEEVSLGETEKLLPTQPTEVPLLQAYTKQEVVWVGETQDLVPLAREGLI